MVGRQSYCHAASMASRPLSISNCDPTWPDRFRQVAASGDTVRRYRGACLANRRGGHCGVEGRRTVVDGPKGDVHERDARRDRIRNRCRERLARRHGSCLRRLADDAPEVVSDVRLQARRKWIDVQVVEAAAIRPWLHPHRHPQRLGAFGRISDRRRRDDGAEAMTNVRDVQRCSDDRGGKITGVVDEHRWLPRPGDVEERGELRRCGDVAEEAWKDVARQLRPWHGPDFRVLLEAELVCVIRREADPGDRQADRGQPLGRR